MSKYKIKITFFNVTYEIKDYNNMVEAKNGFRTLCEFFAFDTCTIELIANGEIFNTVTLKNHLMHKNNK